MKFFLLYFLLTVSFQAQKSVESVLNEGDTPAGYPGGQEAFQKYVSRSIKYPKEALKKGIRGMVSVSFIVEEDGTLSTFKVIRGIGGGCDEEAIRVIQDSGKWLPGTKAGAAVRQELIMNIGFLRGL